MFGSVLVVLDLFLLTFKSVAIVKGSENREHYMCLLEMCQCQYIYTGGSLNPTTSVK
jgi:hypothetical protein